MAGDLITIIQVMDNLIKDVEQPFFTVFTVCAPIVGVMMLVVAMYRIRQHSNPQMMSMHRKSPMATTLFFISGSILISPTEIVRALSQSLFQSASIIKGAATASGCNFTGVLSYYKDLSHQSLVWDPTTETFMCMPTNLSGVSNELMTVHLATNLLFFIGLIAFIRAIALLIRLGEHMGGSEGGLPKAMTHLIAGVVGLNANFVVGIIAATFQQVTTITH